MIELVTALRSDTAVAALVGQRIYPLVMPDNPTFPALVYSVVRATPQNSVRGHTGSLEEVLIQIDCYSKLYSQAQQLADAVHSLLGTDREVAGLKGFRTNRTDLYEDDTKLHRVSMDFTIWKEAAQ